MLNSKLIYTNNINYLLTKYFRNPNKYYILYFKKRFNVKSLQNVKNLFDKFFFNSFFVDIFNDLHYYTYKRVYELILLFIYLRNNFYTYRFFLGYPKSSRTRSNGRSSATQTLFFKNLVIKYIYYRVYKKHKENDKLLLLFVDFFNKLWYFQWYNEWCSARENLEKAVIRRFFKWKFGYLFLSYNRPIVFTPKRSKQKSNKKKQIELKNTYNIGFYLGFTNKYKEIIKRFTTNSKKKHFKSIKSLKKK